MKQNPFSFYDFLGYLIPGAFLLYSFYFGGIHYEWEMALQFKSQLKLNSSFGDLINLFPLVISSYITGHLLSITSSFFIEKYSNCRNGYPSLYLFSGKGKGFFYKCSTLSFLGRVLLCLFILPISIIDTITHPVFRQNKKMDEKLLPVVFKKCMNILKHEFSIDTKSMNFNTGINGDSFRLIYHYAFENSEQHALKLQNYVALYGFTRNIAMASLIIFWTLVILRFWLELQVGSSLIISTAILAFVFYKGFVKFYKRYTLEAMMAACVINKKD
ncbi:hypothetical protein [Erwinia sp.]|uniref:hypothetical protein n=1 Tax=Erwinia citreus TaxID=558 RepID=UPI00289DAD74|nr:hypothetical protein [Erwinia sp.]